MQAGSATDNYVKTYTLCPLVSSFQETYQGQNMQAGSATDNHVGTSTLHLSAPSFQET